jgi:cell division protease FtsH
LAAVLTAALIAVISLAAKRGRPVPAFVAYNEFTRLAEAGEVSGVTISDSPKIKFTTYGLTVYETDNPRSADLKERLLTMGVAVAEETEANTYPPAQFIFGLLCAGAAVCFALRASGKALRKSEAAFDVKEAADSEKTADFNSVAGNDEAKADVSGIVDFIRDPEKYSAYGARMPKGVIFYGPPGTGKTLLARAVAGEAGVPFFAVSGSDFVQMYVGVGAARVRELFQKARKAGKAVIFIDEIDAIGKTRGGGAGGNDERDQTLNALLTEMSGFSGSGGIVVIAATNRLDTLDEALLRPGRFDRHVEVSLPDKNGRAKIIGLHTRGKPMGPDIDWDALAKQTIAFSGAMLENMMNEAAITAAKERAGQIERRHIEAAYYSQLVGSPKLEKAGYESRRLTAYHESGHALASLALQPGHEIAKITIIPSTKGAGGFCVSVPPEKPYITRGEIRAKIIVALSGRAAEDVVFGADNVTTGAANDIEKAAELARDYVCKFGMSDLGALPPGKEAAEKRASELIEELYAEAKEFARTRRDELDALAGALIEREQMSGRDIEGIIDLKR